MRKIRPALILCTATLALLSLFHPSLADQGPRIQMMEKRYDFGPVNEGAVLTHEFKVFNRGDQPLVIERVSPS